MFKKNSNENKSVLIAIILCVFLFGFIFINKNLNDKKLESNYLITDAVITDIKLNVSKGRTQTQNIYEFEFIHNGKKLKKVKELYNSDTIKIGQKIKIKVHSEDSNLYSVEKK